VRTACANGLIEKIIINRQSRAADPPVHRTRRRVPPPRRPNESDLLMPAIEVHAAKLGRIPRLVAADAGFYSGKNEAAAKAKGVKRVCIPNRASKSAARKREQMKRWFRDGQRWRTGCKRRWSAPLPISRR
jgi:hypothetical protein